MQYGLIGYPLGHSYSKEIHAAIASYDYELHELCEDKLAPFFNERDFKAVNVTIPYKQRVIPYLDFVSAEAERIGAVNTIVNRGGKLCGYNTDFAGMRALADRIGIAPAGKKVLVLGTGGTSKTAHAVLESMGAGEIITVSRRGRDGAITYAEALRDHKDAAYIFNTTPVGMYPDTEASPVDLAAFNKLKGVLDVVNNPLRTKLVQQAGALGIPAEGGLYMLSAQAVFASALFLDEPVKCENIGLAYSSVLAAKRNIVLIGMPSCGKTSVGQRLSGLLGKRFADTDEIVKAETGDISEYFASRGEQSFRMIERRAVSSVSAETGLVIATGGGAPMFAENLDALRKNGVLVFLDRGLDKLTATDSRPLSSDSAALAKRYEERYEKYVSAADIVVDGNGSVDETAEMIIKELYK